MDQLDPNTGIWRYMDVARFLAFASEKKLYFARLRELGDPSEGARSSSDPIFFPDPEFQRPAVSDFTGCALASCWHENEGESVAMWKLYVSGREGVAIKTNVGRLGCCASIQREVKVGRVAYRDINDSVDPAEVLLFESGAPNCYEEVLPAERALFRKNKGFEHEREVRAVIYAGSYCAQHAIAATVQNLIAPGPTPAIERGEAVPVNISALIQRIVVSPDFPKWAIASLQKVVDAAGIAVRVEASSLLDEPEIGGNGTVALAATGRSLH